MSQYFESGCRPDTAAGAVAQYLRVKTPGAIAVAGSSDVSIGTMELPCTAAGPCTVRLANAQGTRKMVASEAITAGNPVYAAASGKVAASGTVVEGRAMEAATANNDIIEVMSIANTDLSSSIASTNAATFLVDADATIPKIELGSQTAGTGDYKVTLKPASTLTANRVVTFPDAATQVMVGDTATQTLTNKTLTSPTMTAPVLGVATGTSLAVTGAISSSGTAGVGYATGAGGTVTQATNRTTGVTLSKICGTITTDAASMAAQTPTTFTVTNTLVAATDVVILSKVSGDVDTFAWVNSVGSGSYTVTLFNTHASAADTTAFVFNAVVIKAVAA